MYTSQRDTQLYPVAEAHAPGPRLVEHGKPLAASVIWEWQHRWFENAGLDVWTGDVVPHHINTNSFCVVRYARIAVAWVRSLDAHPTGRWIPGRSALPVLELGAGNGLFAHRFIRAFRRYMGGSAGPRLRYVLSDISEARLAGLRMAKPLREAEARGELSLASYAIGRGAPPPLEGLEGLPLLAIANYVFDGLPTDAYEIAGGQVFGLTPRVWLPPAGEPGEDAAEDPMAHFEVDWERAAFDPAPDDPALGLVPGYLELGVDGCALVPRGALACLRECLATGCEELLLLAADRGTTPEEPLVPGPPTLVRHGSFSVDVSFDAIARWVERAGGAAMTTRSARSNHVSFLGLLGGRLDERPMLRDAWVQGLEELGTDDYLAVKNFAIAQPPGDVWTVLSFLRLSGYDERLLIYSIGALVSSLAQQGGEDARIQRAVRETVEEIRANALPDPHGALEFGMAQVWAAIGDWEGAMKACRASLAIEGDDAVVEFLEVCRAEVEQRSSRRQLQLFARSWVCT